MLGRLPLVEQLDGLRSVLSRNEVLTDVLTRAATLELPLSWKAEDAAIKAGQEVFASPVTHSVS